MATPKLTAERARELFDYDPLTGHLIRGVSRIRYKAGTIAGGVHCKIYGHLRVTVDSERILLHRLVWLHQYGEWPKNKIDHINGDPTDNRLVNLRDVSDAINGQNRHRARRDSKSGYLGVSYVNGRRNTFVAQIRKNGKTIHLGYFDSPEDAHEAYLVAKRRIHEGFVEMPTAPSKA